LALRAGFGGLLPELEECSWEGPWEAAVRTGAAITRKGKVALLAGGLLGTPERSLL